MPIIVRQNAFVGDKPRADELRLLACLIRNWIHKIAMRRIGFRCLPPELFRCSKLYYLEDHLTVNGGSSNIKFAVFTSSSDAKRLASGQAERIGLPDARLIIKASHSAQQAKTIPIAGGAYDAAIESLVGFLGGRFSTSSFAGIGHRIVHGGANLVDHQLVTPTLISELKRIQSLDMAHLPSEITLIERLQKSYPDIPHVACFDTAFHRKIPRVAQLLPIPRHYLDAGVRRFGFHGLSYTYLMKQLAFWLDRRLRTVELSLPTLYPARAWLPLVMGIPSIRRWLLPQPPD